MSIDVNVFHSCVESHLQKWGLVDEILYKLCSEHRSHDDLPGICAKVLLIGRGFASGVERHISSDGAQGSSIEKLALHLFTYRDEIDEIINRLARLEEPLDIQKLSIIIEEHGKFCQIMSKITRNEISPVSFASKYLHFHCPIVPIYDSWVSKHAWRMRKDDELQRFEKSGDGHDEYYWYSVCFWQQYTSLREVSSKITVRLTEVYILWLAG